MRILFQFYDKKNYTAGPVINAVRLIQSFHNRSHEVYGLCVHGIGPDAHPNADQLSKLGIKVFSHKYFLSTESEAKWIYSIVRKVEPDIFVANISIAGCFLAKWLIPAGICVINTCRSFDKRNLERAIYFSDFKSEWSSSALVSVSNYLDNYIKKTIPDSIYATVIPSGVPSSPFRASHDKVSPLKIVYAGRIEQKQKRVIDMTRLFIKLAKGFEEKIEFTIIGSGSDFEKVKELVGKSNRDKNFTFMGVLRDDQYKKALAENHVIALFSEYEGMPGAMMDGISCGLIPVCTNFKGVNEIVENQYNGYIIDLKYESLKRVVNEIINNRTKRDEISKNAVLTFQQNYSLNEAINKWEQLFYKLREDSRKRKKSTLPEKISLPKFCSELQEFKSQKKNTLINIIRLELRHYLSKNPEMFNVYQYLKRLVRK